MCYTTFFTRVYIEDFLSPGKLLILMTCSVRLKIWYVGKQNIHTFNKFGYCGLYKQLLRNGVVEFSLQSTTNVMRNLL